ncbi:MAG: hypothetical protein ACODAQ_08305 [Phycisphaeraceae bacterium]
MPRKIGARRRAALIRDLFNASHDVIALAEMHGLSPDALATWAGEGNNQRCLRGLCTLADLQAQLLLSRYRLHTAARLVRLGTDQDQQVNADVARKACVDVLRMDLKRAEADADAETSTDALDDAASLRAVLYGEDGRTDEE